MGIEVTCSGCGNVLNVADSMAGKKGKCPQCKTVLYVPEIGGEEGYEPEAPAVEEDDYAAEPDPVQTKPGQAICPNCGNKLGAGEIFCVKCGTNIKTGKKMEGI